MSPIDEPEVAARIADDGRVKAIEAEFPRWQVWVSDSGWWWAAIRRGLTAGQKAAGCVSFLRGRDADELSQKIREQERLFAVAAEAGGEA